MIKFLKKIDINRIFNIIIFLSILECVFINIFVPHNIGLHDEGAFKDLFYGMEFIDGNLGYIEYLYKYRHLPDFDVSTVWGFYNPPFYHICGAILTSILTLFIKSTKEVAEALQFMNVGALFFSLLFFKKILFKLNINNNSRVIALLLFSFHPWMFMFSMMMSTDMFALMFSIMIMYYTLVFYKENSYKNIIKLAFTFGFAMMTKLSLAFFAIPCGYIFLIILLNKIIFAKNIRAIIDLVLKYFLFLIITILLGLFNPIRNKILFNLPFSFVQRIKGANLIPNLNWFKFPNIVEYFSKPMYYDTENNIWFAAFRSSIFDEFNFKEPVLAIAIITLVLYFILFVSIIFLFMFIKKKMRYINFTISIEYFIFLTLVIITYLILYVQFNYNYPMYSSSNFRYIVMILPIIFLLLSLVLNYYKKNLICLYFIVANVLVHFLVIVYFAYGFYLFKTTMAV